MMIKIFGLKFCQSSFIHSGFLDHTKHTKSCNLFRVHGREDRQRECLFAAKESPESSAETGEDINTDEIRKGTEQHDM
jgi:hypothetical protein